MATTSAAADTRAGGPPFSLVPIGASSMTVGALVAWSFAVRSFAVRSIAVSPISVSPEGQSAEDIANPLLVARRPEGSVRAATP
jgi:hypothetical protein